MVVGCKTSHHDNFQVVCGKSRYQGVLWSTLRKYCRCSLARVRSGTRSASHATGVTGTLTPGNDRDHKLKCDLKIIIMIKIYRIACDGPDKEVYCNSKLEKYSDHQFFQSKEQVSVFHSHLQYVQCRWMKMYFTCKPSNRWFQILICVEFLPVSITSIYPPFPGLASPLPYKSRDRASKRFSVRAQNLLFMPNTNLW